MLTRDARRLWHADVAHIGVSNFVTRLGALAQRILLARLLGAENIGHMAVVTSVTNIIRVPAGVGTYTVVNKLVAENQGDDSAQREIVGTSLIINSITTVVVAVCSWLVLTRTTWVPDEVANGLLRILILFLPFIISSEIFRNSLMGQRKMRSVAAIDLLLAAWTIVVVVPMAYVWSLNGWFANKVLSILVGFGLLLWNSRSILGLRWNGNVARTVASIGTFAFLHQLTGSLILQFDTLSVSGLLRDPAATGVYNNAALMAQQLQFIPGAILTVVFPYVAENKRDWQKLRTRYQELFRKVGSLAIILSVISWIVAPWFFPVFGPAFEASAAPFRVLIMGFVARSLGILNNTYLDALGRTDISFATSLVVAVLTVLLNVTFIPRWGLMGAAWATTLSLFVSLLLKQGCVRHYIFHRHAIR